MSTKTNDTKRAKPEKEIKDPVIKFVRELIERYPEETDATAFMNLPEMKKYLKNNFYTNATEKYHMRSIIKCCIDGMSNDEIRLYCKSIGMTTNNTNDIKSEDDPDVRTSEDNKDNSSVSSYDDINITDEVIDNMLKYTGGILPPEITKNQLTTLCKILLSPKSLSRPIEVVIKDIESIIDIKANDDTDLTEFEKCIEFIKANAEDIANTINSGEFDKFISMMDSINNPEETTETNSDNEKNPENKKEKVVKAEEVKPEEQPRRRMIDHFNFGKKKTADEIFADWQQRHPILR